DCPTRRQHGRRPRAVYRKIRVAREAQDQGSGQRIAQSPRASAVRALKRLNLDTERHRRLEWPAFLLVLLEQPEGEPRAYGQAKRGQPDRAPLVLVLSRMPERTPKRGRIGPAVLRALRQRPAQYPPDWAGYAPPTSPAPPLTAAPVPSRIRFVDDERRRIKIAQRVRFEARLLLGRHVKGRSRCLPGQ